MPCRRGAAAYRLNALLPFAAKHDCDESSQYQDRDRAADLQEIHHHQAVFAGGGIIMVAEEQHLVDRGADRVVGCLDERKPHVLDQVIDAVEVARHPSRRASGP